MEFKGDKELPSLKFNEEEGLIEISGRSIGTRARNNFWQPLIDKMEEYLDEARDITLNIDLEYFATSSAKAMFDLFKLIQKKVNIKQKKFIINWYYEDEDILEAGEDYSLIIPNTQFNFIEKE
jgi:hypothetical protein